MKLSKRDLLLGIGGSILLTGCLGSTSETIESYSTQEVKTGARQIPYDELARDIEEYRGTSIYQTGEIIQHQENDELHGFNISIGKVENTDTWDPSKNVVVLWDGERFIEGDVVEFWGVVEGYEQYETVFGSQTNVPQITAVDVNLLEETDTTTGEGTNTNQGEETDGERQQTDGSNETNLPDVEVLSEDYTPDMEESFADSPNSRIRVEYNKYGTREQLEYTVAEEGMMWLILELEIENVGDSAYTTSPDIMLRSGDETYEIVQFLHEKEIEFQQELEPGESTQGFLVFQVPREVGTVTLTGYSTELNQSPAEIEFERNESLNVIGNQGL
jgi:hypothetical protein